MNIWHGTSDAPRSPRRVSPQQHVELIMGTWPIEPGQSVWVVWESVNADRHLSGTVAAQWQRNSDTNSYWKARLGRSRTATKSPTPFTGRSPTATSKPQPM